MMQYDVLNVRLVSKIARSEESFSMMCSTDVTQCGLDGACMVTILSSFWLAIVGACA